MIVTRAAMPALMAGTQQLMQPRQDEGDAEQTLQNVRQLGQFAQNANASAASRQPRSIGEGASLALGAGLTAGLRKGLTTGSLKEGVTTGLGTSIGHGMGMGANALKNKMADVIPDHTITRSIKDGFNRGMNGLPLKAMQQKADTVDTGGGDDEAHALQPREDQPVQHTLPAIAPSEKIHAIEQAPAVQAVRKKGAPQEIEMTDVKNWSSRQLPAAGESMELPHWKSAADDAAEDFAQGGLVVGPKSKNVFHSWVMGLGDDMSSLEGTDFTNPWR